MRWLVIAAVLAVSATASARPRFGVRLGVNLATVEDYEAEGELSKRIALAAGGFVLVPLAKHLAFEAGFAYSQKGGATQSGLGELRLDYIHVPLLVVGLYKVGPMARVRAFAGPDANVNVYERQMGGGELDLDGHASAIDYGAILGAGLEIDTDVGIIILDVRYEYGITDLDTGSDTVEHRVLSATAGFAY